MKTERRHELQHNALADKVAAFIDAAEPYSRAILAGVVLVMALIFAYIFISTRQAEALAHGWDSFFDAMGSGNPEQTAAMLLDTADKYPDTHVAEWARLASADLTLAQSIDRALTDKADAREHIKRALELYEKLRKSDERAIYERATFGMARAHESLNELDKARTEYEAVAKNGGAYAGLAALRAKELNTADQKEFYDWYAKYEPKPPASKPDKKPDFNDDSLGGPSDTLPPVRPADMSPPADSSAPAETAAPADSAAPPESPAPADGATDDKAGAAASATPAPATPAPSAPAAPAATAPAKASPAAPGK